STRLRRYQVIHDDMNSDDGPPVSALPARGELQATIGLVGRISPWKGQHIFLRAAVLVRERYPRARFQIVGAALFSEHDFEREIHALADSLGVADAVEFTGFREDVGDLIAAMDVLVHASTIGEPFGQVVIEGMAAGKPIVATNGGGIPEIVQDGVTGLLVPMGDAAQMADAVCQLLADPVKSQEMGQLGRRRVMKYFTIQQTAARVERIYDRVLPRALRF
ncbi:MAG TPA: glycosyltransferase family 4 protein, partial [Humisphaera sp.]|nr:glycosyltransferase family 4 protein [Humisphaera sp.]